MDFIGFPVSFADFDDGRFAYRVFGEGSPLLLIMGSGGTMDMWAPHFLDVLSKNFKLILFDNRGMGLSRSDDVKFTLEGFADDTANLIRELGFEKVDVLGWSMGGEVALELALKYPDRVKRLILYAGDCGGKEAIYAPDEVIEKLNRSSGIPKKMVQELLPLMFPPEWFLTHSHPEKFFRQIHESSPKEYIRKQGEAMANWKGVYGQLSAIKNKTLILHGNQDIIVPSENSGILHDKIINSKLIVYPTAGHCLMYEHPLKLAKDIITFLRS